MPLPLDPPPNQVKSWDDPIWKSWFNYLYKRVTEALNITTADIEDGAVTTAKIADANVTADKIDTTTLNCVVDTHYATNSTRTTDATSNMPIAAIPINTDGTELFTTSYTPKSTGNLLQVHFGALMSGGATGHTYACAIFQDSITNALGGASAHNEHGDGYAKQINGYFEMTAGTVSAITFKMRFGGSTTAYINGDSATEFTLGGINPAYIKITEILQ